MNLERWLEMRLENASVDTVDIDGDDVLDHCSTENPICDMEWLNLAIHALANLSEEYRKDDTKVQMRTPDQYPLTSSIAFNAGYLERTLRSEAARIAAEHNNVLQEMRNDAAWGDPCLSAAERNA